MSQSALSQKNSAASEVKGIKSWPVSERPREMLLTKGPDALSDAEVLAILLRDGTKGQDVVTLARRLIQKFGSLRQLLLARPDELYQVNGVGPAKAAQILAACEISNRRLKEKAMGVNVVKSPRAVFNYLSSSMRDLKEEVFKGLFLNRKNEVIEILQLASGTPDKVTLYPRRIVERCATIGATKLILVHNHPSGSLVPSNWDIQFTAKMREGLKFLEVELLDHIIIGKEGFHSMNERGDLNSI